MADNITQFNAPEGATIRPTDRALDTAREVGMQKNRLAREEGAILGGAISRVGGQVGERIDNHIAGQMIGHGAVVSSQLTAQLTKQIDDTMTRADVNDTSVGQGQRENVDKSLQTFQDQFADAPEKVQNWALATADHLRTHFGNSITAHEMSRAADAAELNMRDTGRANANTVGLDPASLQGMIDKQHRDFDAYISTHTLPEGAVGALRKRLDAGDSALAMTAAKSIIEKNPAAWDKLKADGAYDKYLDPEQKLRLDSYARSTATHMREDELRDQAEARRQAAQASQDRWAEYDKQTYDHISGRILPPSPKLNMQIQNDPTMLQKDKNALIRWNQSQFTAQRREDKELAAGRMVKDDPVVRDDLRDRVKDVNNPTTRQEIQDALDAEKLTPKTAHDYTWRVGQREADWNAIQRQFKPQFDNIKHALTASMEGKMENMTDGEAFGQRLNQMEQDAQHKLRTLYDAKDKAGLQAALTPGSPQYVFANQAARPAGAVLKEGADKVRAPNPVLEERYGAPPRAFKNEAEVKAAKLPNGTVITINGKKFVWNN